MNKLNQTLITEKKLEVNKHILLEDDLNTTEQETNVFNMRQEKEKTGRNIVVKLEVLKVELNNNKVFKLTLCHKEEHPQTKTSKFDQQIL